MGLGEAKSDVCVGLLSILFSAIKFLVLQAFLTTTNLHLTESYSSIIPHVRSAPQMIVRRLRSPTATMVSCKKHLEIKDKINVSI